MNNAISMPLAWESPKVIITIAAAAGGSFGYQLGKASSQPSATISFPPGTVITIPPAASAATRAG